MVESVDSLEQAMRYDLVSIGGGLSGLVAACRAGELGATAAVLERASEDRYPCSSRWTTGVVNVMGRPILAPPDTLYDAILSGSGSNAEPSLARAVADNAKRAIEWLRALGTRFVQRGLQQDQPGQQVLAPPRRLQAGLDWEGRGGDVLMRSLEARIAQRTLDDIDGDSVDIHRVIRCLIALNDLCGHGYFPWRAWWPSG